MGNPPHKTDNPFVFSDETELDDFVFKWAGYGNPTTPEYSESKKCVRLFFGRLIAVNCKDEPIYSLCKVEDNSCPSDNECP